MVFKDRTEAGRRLAKLLKPYASRDDVIVLGIPRGGVPVAFEVAVALKAPLDLFLLRKLGVPGQEELAFGAIASGGVRVLDHEIVDGMGLSNNQIETVVARETTELQRRERLYRGGHSPLDIRGFTLVLVDDGIATGSSMRAAIAALRQRKPSRLVIAVPVAPSSTCKRLQAAVDELVCDQMPESFYAIGQFYEDFSQVTDEEVIDLLDRAARSAPEKVI